VNHPGDPRPGEPTATLVLLPGIDGTEVFFRPLLAALPEWVRPVVVTYPTSGGNGYADLLEIVRSAVADALAFHVLGWSFSGPLALMLAAKEPGRTRGVILAASFVRPPLPLVARVPFVFGTPVVRLIRLARRTPVVLSRPRSDPYRRDKAAVWGRVPSRVLAARARAILSVDARRWLRECPAPVLYLAGSRDSIVPGRNAAEVLRERPSARVVTIDGPHLAMYSNPGAAASAIAGFMREGTEPGPGAPGPRRAT
jgi:pimeloyl-ACP methyl ester carboxylesterase